jgi:Flp pilus assembly pilin Flp
MVEYALILALVSIAAIVTLKAVGVEVTSVLTDVKTALTGV